MVKNIDPKTLPSECLEFINKLGGVLSQSPGLASVTMPRDENALFAQFKSGWTLHFWVESWETELAIEIHCMKNDHWVGVYKVSYFR